MKFHLWKFLALLLIGFFLFSTPQIINRFVVHNSVTHQFEEVPKQIHHWQQSVIALYTPQRANF